MDLATILRRRRMVRRFTADPVSDASLDAILDAAVRSPTAGFTQGVSYQLLTGPDVATYWEVTAGTREGGAWLSGLQSAPVLLLVWTSETAYLDRYARPDKGWTDRDPARWSAPYWWVDAGMGAMAALLAAVDHDLGACFFGVPPERQERVRVRFGVPADQASVGVVALGHASPSTPATPRARRERRLVVHRGRWTTET